MHQHTLPRFVSLASAAALGAGALLGLAACGGDDPSLSVADFTAQANAICADHDAKIGAIVGDLFSTGAPDQAKMQPALDGVLAETEALLAEIDALNEPEELRSGVESFVAEGRKAAEATKAQGGPAYWGTDDNPWVETGNQAKALGLDACAAEQD